MEEEVAGVREELHFDIREQPERVVEQVAEPVGE